MGIKGPTTEQLLDMYAAMWRIRLFEEQAEYQSGQGKVLGALHTYIGQEAVGVGICAHLTDADYITSTHRGHGHCISKGADVRRMMAELFGRVTGYCKGKGGSMHIADFAVGMLGANGIVAGGFGLATGAGLAAQVRESGQVAVCFFGDGAVNRGPFHEKHQPGSRLAAARRLRLREQPVRPVDSAGGDHPGDRRGLHVFGLRDSRRSGGRDGRPVGVRGGRRGRRPGPPGRGTHAAGVQDLPLPWPQLRRPPAVSNQGGDFELVRTA